MPITDKKDRFDGKLQAGDILYLYHTSFHLYLGVVGGNHHWIVFIEDKSRYVNAYNDHSHKGVIETYKSHGWKILHVK